jgi:hypothetical protein
MRCLAASSLLALAAVGLAGGARADVTFELRWRDTGTRSLDILPGDAAVGGQRTLDILMSLDVQWVLFAVTVALPDGSGVSFLDAELWEGVPGASWVLLGPELLDVDDPLWRGDLDPYQEAYEFASFLAPPAGPPWVPPGEYEVGSVVIETSRLLGGASIETFFVPRLDGLGVDDGAGNLIYSDDAQFLGATLGTAQLFVIPEPATGGLTGAGLLLLAWLRRRRQERWPPAARPRSQRGAASSQRPGVP